MLRFKPLFVSLLLLTVGFNHQSIAQEQVAQRDYGQWLMYFGDNKISRRFGVHTELQLRNYVLDRTVPQLLTRVGLNYYVNSDVMITGGYGYIHTRPSEDEIPVSKTSEHRIWQQLVLRQNPGVFSLEHRYRIEQRFVDNLNTGESEYKNRMRYRLKLVVPFDAFIPELTHVFFAAYDELFVNTGQVVSSGVFDRNRLYFALGYKISPQMNVQVGYLNQQINTGGMNDVNHNLQVGFTFNPRLSSSQRN